MSRKPVHLEAQGPKGSRQAMWEEIRRLHLAGQPINAPDVRGQLKTVVPVGRVRDYLTGLEKAGYLRRIAEPRKSGQPVQYTLARDVGVEAPRARRDGSEPAQGRGREQMWRTLRILGEFSARQLASAASTPAVPVAEATASEYCRYLKAGGYLQTARPSAPGQAERFRLVKSRWSGPRAPMIQRVKQLYDPNTGKVVVTRGLQGENGDNGDGGDA